MVFVVIHKYINCANDKAIETGHSASADCKSNYIILLLTKLFITYWYKPSKADPSGEIGIYATW